MTKKSKDSAILSKALSGLQEILDWHLEHGQFDQELFESGDVEAMNYPVDEGGCDDAWTFDLVSVAWMIRGLMEELKNGICT